MASSEDDRFEPYEAAAQAAAARILPRRRRLSLEEAEGIVAAEFSAQGISIPSRAARHFAYNMLHPFWPFLHPLRARREGWRFSWR